MMDSRFSVEDSDAAAGELCQFEGVESTAGDDSAVPAAVENRLVGLLAATAFLGACAGALLLGHLVPRRSGVQFEKLSKEIGEAAAEPTLVPGRGGMLFEKLAKEIAEAAAEPTLVPEPEAAAEPTPVPEPEAAAEPTPVPEPEAAAEPTVDVFIRSYSGDLQWLEFVTASLEGSIARQPGILNKVIISVPTGDVPAFQGWLDAIWKLRQLRNSTKDRFIVVRSNTVIGSPYNWFKSAGYMEQMLDKLHADHYCNASHIMFLDTDTVLWRDVTREQLFDPQGRPYMSWRYAAESGPSWSQWMQGPVEAMFGFPPEDQRCWGKDFMVTLGFAYDRKLFPHLRQEVIRHNGGNGEQWDMWVKQARSGGVFWKGPIPFTDFNAMGYILCRDFNDSNHWMHKLLPDSDMLVDAYHTWSWATDMAVVNAEKQKLNCLIQHQNLTDPADNRLARIALCGR